MQRRDFLRSALAGGSGVALMSAAGLGAVRAGKKNVVFIVCDDFNDSVHGLGGHPQAYTPNLDRLRKWGVTFTNAHANAPMCAPCRPSMLSGLLPSSTGMYHSKPEGDEGGFRSRSRLKDAVLIPTHFRNNGYKAYSTGKLFHDIDLDLTVFGASAKDRFDGGFLGYPGAFGPYPWDGETLEWGRPSRSLLHPARPSTIGTWHFGFGRLSEKPSFPNTGEFHWVYQNANIEGEDGKRGGLFKYNGPDDRSPMPDELIAGWAISLLKGEPAQSFGNIGPSWEAGSWSTATPIGDSPFVIFCGLCKTHVSNYVADEFYDAVLEANGISGPDEIEIVGIPEGSTIGNNKDMDDIPARLKGIDGYVNYNAMVAAAKEYPGGVTKLFKDYMLAYLASVYEIDVQVGKILDTLEATGHRDDTIVVFTSDHGFHTCGEKQRFFKYTLWGEATRVPLIVCDPDHRASAGRACDYPVSLIDLYPTLVDLCGLPSVPAPGETPALDGHSLRPFLEEPSASAWDGAPVALMCLKSQAISWDKAAPVNTWSDTIHPDLAACSLRSRYWRYTQSYNDGVVHEELYNTNMDPEEYENLADDPQYLQIKKWFDYHLSRTAKMDSNHRTQYYAPYAPPADFNPDVLAGPVVARLVADDSENRAAKRRICAHPNPFVGTTAIRYRVPHGPGEGSAALDVRLDVFDDFGRRVATLAYGPMAPGSYSATWNGCDSGGLTTGAGHYSCRLTIGKRIVETRTLFKLM